MEVQNKEKTNSETGRVSEFIDIEVFEDSQENNTPLDPPGTFTLTVNPGSISEIHEFKRFHEKSGKVRIQITEFKLNNGSFHRSPEKKDSLQFRIEKQIEYIRKQDSEDYLNKYEEIVTKMYESAEPIKMPIKKTGQIPGEDGL